ncbi:hypothetical protein [Pseudomonas marincola]|jgi:hypothetical protein|uniref:hypothetical protein n=1 Tax=Pseudomonas marincola TaxID=437900 RepID=UPI0008F0BE77|nr:hypothetical protein [Pseudomonas marincola]SFU19389.1 hypothetical protein SAMN05216264_12140 [Pseudomonas marincola]
MRTFLNDQDIDAMSLTELSAWYVEMVGYDPLEEDPSLEPAEFRADCKEYALIMRCGGLDTPEYQAIEAARKRASCSI